MILVIFFIFFFLHSLPLAHVLKITLLKRLEGFIKNQSFQVRDGAVSIQFQTAFENGTRVFSFKLDPSRGSGPGPEPETTKSISQHPGDAHLEFPSSQVAPVSLRLGEAALPRPPPEPGGGGGRSPQPRGRQRALLCSWERRGRLGVWPGEGIFVLFKCQH